MRTSWTMAGLTAGILTMTLAYAPMAQAATGGDSSSSPGVTSGPAAGSTAVPEAAVRKQPRNQDGSSAGGAPGVTGSGVTGKQGAESGAAPAKSSSANR
jgi:hypothetical protein